MHPVDKAKHRSTKDHPPTLLSTNYSVFRSFRIKQLTQSPYSALQKLRNRESLVKETKKEAVISFIVCPCNMIDIFIITNTMHTIEVDKITLIKTT